MISEHSTLVSYLPTRDSSSIADLVPGLLPSGGGCSSSVDGIATDTSNPSAMTEQFNASSAQDRNTGRELMRGEAVEAQLEPESPSCSIRTERTGRYIRNKEEVENEQTHITSIDANETVDEIELSQGRTDKELHAIATVYGGAYPPPLPPTSISKEKNLEEYLSQFRQLSKSERRKLLGEVKTILDVGDKSMISGFDGYGGRGMSDELRRNNNQYDDDDDDDDDSLLASSEEGTALDSRASSYCSDSSTAFYTNDISTAFFTADTRGSMYSNADTYYTSDDDNHARYARKYRNGGGGGGGGGGRRQGIGKTATRARSRGRRKGRLYQDVNGNEEDDLSEELFVAMMNFPCMSYLFCDYKSEIEEANVPEQTTEINDLEADHDSWDWNNRGKKQKRSRKVTTATHRPAKNSGKGENIKDIDQIRVNCSENHMDGKCSPSFSLTSHSGMTVKERMEKLEERLFGKPTTSDATIMEKLSAVDDTNEDNMMKKTTSPDILEGDKVQYEEQTVNFHDGEDENDERGNGCGVVQSDGIPSENISDAIDVATKDMESKLALSSCESESVGVEVNSVDAFEDNALSTEIKKANKNPILDRINNEVVVKKAKSFTRQRSESPFMKAITTLSRKSSKAGTAVDDAKLSRTESSQRNVGTGDKSVTTQRSASPFLKAIPSLTRTASRLNDFKPVDERITPPPAKVSEQAEGSTCCNKSSATEVSDDTAEMPVSITRHESPEPPASSKTVLSNLFMEQRQQVPESPIELVHQKPPRAQKKRFKMSLFTRKKNSSITKSVESPTRNKKQSEPSLPTSPVITVRSVESSDSPTTPITPNKFEYQEKTELADVMYVALRDSPVSTSTTSSAASRKKRRGWKEYTDLTTGEKYYSDGVTTTWIKPVDFSRDSSPVTTSSCNDANHLESQKRGKKKGWREYIDRSTGKTYYSDGMTTSWTKPVNLVQ